MSRGVYRLFIAEAGTSENVMSEKAALHARIAELDRQIAEVRKRLPAHSIKPPIMIELLALEDERDILTRQYLGRTAKDNE